MFFELNPRFIFADELCDFLMFSGPAPNTGTSGESAAADQATVLSCFICRLSHSAMDYCFG